MSNRDELPQPLDAILRAVGGPGNDERASTFARGLALGALVGAAIAGSTIWQRRHARPSRPAASIDPGTVPTVEPIDPSVGDSVKRPPPGR